MTKTVRFTKMHGCGNDYIYVNTLLYNIEDPSAASIKWSAPHTGIGSDGLVLIGEAKMPEADYSMRIFNADGSEAMMCGNASRCIGKYLFEKGIDKIQIFYPEGLAPTRKNVIDLKMVDLVAGGSNLVNAFHKIETAETYAKTFLYSKIIGNQALLNENELADLAELRKKIHEK